MPTHASQLVRALGAGLGVLCLVSAVAAAQPGELPADPAAAAPPEVAEELGMDPYAGAAGVPTAGPAPAAGAAGDGSSALERAWREHPDDLQERVFQVRRQALEVGVWSFAPAARALMAQGEAGSRLERARAAVALAPDLPAAHMELASALWLEGDDALAALRSVFGAAAAGLRHVEASFWLVGSGLYLLAVALLVGGLVAMALAGISGMAHAAHDFGHAVPGPLPEFARFALLAAVLLVPLGLGEGLLGLALGLAAVAALTGGRSHQLGMAIAAAGIGLGAYPVAQAAGAVLEAFPLDPVARAAFSVGEGLATPVDLARLEAAADDPLAARALAGHARRHGRLAEADAHYQALLEAGASDAATLNNAANVRLDLGHVERAIGLYGEALAGGELPIVLFNLAQAHGRGFQVEDLNQIFARAQSVGGDLVAHLTALQGTDLDGFVVDYPLSPSAFWSRVWERVREGGGAAVAAELRARVAPGRLGDDWRSFAAAAAAVIALGSLIGALTSPSRWCARCGGRVCPRCDPQKATGRVCAGCRRLFYQPEKTDRLLRMQRVEELQLRERRLGRVVAAVSVLLPGAAGLLSGSALRCWVGAVCFALAAAAWISRDGIVPDPSVVGAAGPVAFLCIAGVAGLGYAVVVAASLSARSNA